jgi:hypothetical protein
MPHVSGPNGADSLIRRGVAPQPPESKQARGGWATRDVAMQTGTQLSSDSEQHVHARHALRSAPVAARAHAPDRPKLGLRQLTHRKPPQRNTT